MCKFVYAIFVLPTQLNYMIFFVKRPILFFNAHLLRLWG